MKKLITLLLVLTGMVSTASADDYRVVGDAAMLGTSWDGTDEANIMTLVRDNTYILEKQVTISEAGWKEFKVYKNGNWSDGQWPNSGNAGLTLSVGTYNIIFVFKLDHNETFAFTSENGIAVKGTYDSWAAELKLTQDATDALTYTGVYENYNATVGDVEYTAHANNEWNYQIKDGDNNLKYGINEAQKFDLFFTVDLGKRTASMEAKRVVELGEKGLGTFSSVDAHNFAGIEGLQAYYVSEITSTGVKLATIDDVPPSNGVVLKGAPNGRYTIPFGTATGTIDGNKLWAATSATAVDDVYGGGAYILYTDGLFHPATAGGSVPAGKGYLRKGDLVDAGVPTAARSLSLIFEEESTGIEGVKNVAVENNVFYNLAGQRIVAPTKGLYIVNGKKVMVK